MSSSEDEYGQQGKRRRTERACDVCRRRKIRCEGVEVEGQKCAHCQHMGHECTFTEPKRRRGPTKRYVRNLEERLQQVEHLLRQQTQAKQEDGAQGPHAAVTSTPPTFYSSASDSPDNQGNHADDKSTAEPFGYALTQLSPRPSNDDDEDEPFYESTDDEDAGDFAHNGMPRWMQKMDLKAGPSGYQGKGSRVSLVRDAFRFRKEYYGSLPASLHDINEVSATLRPEMWKVDPWEPNDTPRPVEVQERPFIFPETDLLDHLVDCYFRHANPYMPILNSVLFKRYVEEGLHLTDQGFGSTLLLVVALGARASDDPRALLQPDDKHSAGWKWFNQVQQLKKPITATATLYDLQIILLTCLFLHGSSIPGSGWSLLGTGIRLALDVGAHRRKTYGSKPSVHSEMWKRVFWSLLILDRQISANLGRTCAIYDEDIDVDLPIECDDEYWFAADSTLAFKQPTGKPCSISFFIHLIKYFRIVPFVLRTLYTANRSTTFASLLDRTSNGVERIVTYCNSALNEWEETTPEHLKWDPDREDLVLLNQSSVLRVLYYQLQITIHQPFSPLRKKNPHLHAVPSLMICSNAARSIGNHFGTWMKRTNEPIAWHIMPPFIAGCTLLARIWRTKQESPGRDTSADLAAARQCVKALEACENVWKIAGRQRDGLHELAAVYGLSLSDTPVVSNHPTSSATEESWGTTTLGPDHPTVIYGISHVPASPVQESTDATSPTIEAQWADIMQPPIEAVWQQTYQDPALFASSYDLPYHMYANIYSEGSFYDPSFGSADVQSAQNSNDWAFFMDNFSTMAT